MSVLKVLLVTLLAGSLSIGVALFGQRWIDAHPDFALRPSHPSAQTVVLPDLRLTDIDGEGVSSHSWAGRILVMHFWATWCGPCLAQIGPLERLQSQYAKSVLQVVSVAIDSPSEVAAFLAERPLDYSVVLGGIEEVDLSARLGNRTRALPFTVIFDDHGRSVFSRTGELTEETVNQIVTDLLPPAAKDALPTGASAAVSLLDAKTPADLAQAAAPAASPETNSAVADGPRGRDSFADGRSIRSAVRGFL